MIIRYDALLNIRNQELNTDQLALLHHHLTTVFALTSHAGVTHGKEITDNMIKALEEQILT